ncbi:TonB-dependent receptor [Thalassospira sp. MA62]|nr:TonB-dependent receptor [Thalassospira sp. MA62]
MASISRFLQGASLVALSAALTVPGYAQEATPNEVAQSDEATVYTLPEIVITGEKFDRSFHETPTSVAPLTSEDLAKHPEASEVQDVISDVPNVLYTGKADGAPVIRGQAAQGANTGAIAFFGGTVPRATINLDGHYQSYYEFVFGTASVWDLDTVEVYRGPQTSSQGANSIAGAIVMKTKDPTFTHEGAVQAELGNYNRRRASAMYSGPISNDLAVRIAVDHAGRDTFIDYNNPAFNNNGIDLDLKSQTGRLKLLWMPSALPDLEAKYTLSYSKSTRPSLEAAGQPYDDLNSNVTSMPNFKQRTATHIFDVSYDFANDISLFNETQYSNLDTKRNTFPSAAGEASLDQENISNESRLTFGSSLDTLSGMTGYYVTHTDSEEKLNQGGETHFDDTKNNVGIFGEVNYRFADRWIATGGLRLEHDNIKREGFSNLASSDLDYDETFTELLPKASLAYEVTPDITVGGMIKRGYNPGGVTLNFTSSGDFERFDEETLWDYELFTRAKFLDDRLFVNANLFYMDMEDAQRYFMETIGSTTNVFVLNADEASSYGLEVSADYQMTDDLRIKGGFGLLKTEINKFSARPAYEGNEFYQAPAYNFNVGFDYNIMPELMWSVDARFTDGYYSDTENSASDVVDRYGMINTRLTYDVQENVALYGYVNNILDERTPTKFHARYGAYMTEPRMFGGGVKVTF